MFQIHNFRERNKFMMSILDHEQLDLIEYFWVILLTRSNHILGVMRISEGSTTGTVVSAKEIFQLALISNLRMHPVKMALLRRLRYT